MKTKVKDILLAVNGTQLFKYPFGNKELTEELKRLEVLKKIRFNSFTSTWEKV